MNPEINYQWKMKGLAKGVDPSRAAEELHRLQDIYGQLSPEIIVNEAKNPNSILHPVFEWNNTKAAFNYRLQQARILLNNIQIKLITDGETREISVFEVTTFKDGYKSIDTFSPDNIEYVKDSIKQQLEYLRNKLKLYKEFNEILELINQAIEKIN